MALFARILTSFSLCLVLFGRRAGVVGLVLTYRLSVRYALQLDVGYQ